MRLKYGNPGLKVLKIISGFFSKIQKIMEPDSLKTSQPLKRVFCHKSKLQDRLETNFLI
jgi:hypothetical protein